MYKLSKGVPKEIVEEFARIITDKQVTLKSTIEVSDLTIRALIGVANKIAYRQYLLDKNRDPENLREEIDTACDEVTELITQHAKNMTLLETIEKAIKTFEKENNICRKENETLH